MSHPAELLSAYLDGEVTDEERRVIARHLPDCELCRAELVDLHAARSALRSLPVLDLPSGFFEAGSPGPVVPFGRRPRVWAAAAAVVAGFIGIAAFIAPEPAVPVTFIQLSVEHCNRSQLDPPLTPGKAMPSATLPIGGAE